MAIFNSYVSLPGRVCGSTAEKYLQGIIDLNLKDFTKWLEIFSCM